MARSLLNDGAGPNDWRPRQERRFPMLSCDYNGWNDAPEDEREYFDQHPEIWTGAARASDTRPYRVVRPAPGIKHRGGMAA